MAKKESEEAAAGEAPAAVPAEAAPEPAAAASEADRRSGLAFVLDVPLKVTVEIGAARLRVGVVLQLDRGSVIELDRLTGEPVDVLVNGRLVAQGEVTTEGERLAVRLLTMAERPPVDPANA